MAHQYDPLLSLNIAQAIAEAYTPDKSGVLASFSGEVGRVNIIRIRKDALLVTYPGTRIDHPKDIFADLDARFKTVVLNGYSCRVHTGFWDTLQEVQHSVDDWLDEHQANDLVYAGGHSLGGSWAGLHAAQRQFEAVYTYGQPRTGDSAFVKRLQAMYPDSFHRVVNDRDLVPHEPKEFSGYADSSPVLMYDHKGKLHKLQDEGLPTMFLREGLEDHLLETGYIPLLETLQSA